MPTDTDPRAIYDTVATELTATSPTRQSKMFSMPCLKHDNGKAFAGFHRGTMVFKLTAPQHAKALALSGSHLFDPAGSGRLWKEWVEVAAEHASQWLELAQAAFRYIDKTGK